MQILKTFWHQRVKWFQVPKSSVVLFERAACAFLFYSRQLVLVEPELTVTLKVASLV